MKSEEKSQSKLVTPLPLSVYTNPKYDKVRRRKIIMFTECLSKHESYAVMPLQERQKIAQCVEESIPYDANYHEKCYEIATLIDPEVDGNSKTFCDSVLKLGGKFDGTKKLIDLAPEKYEKYVQLLKNKTTYTPPIKVSELYRCPKCKQYKSRQENLHNRALDECQGVVAICLNCGCKWKV